MQISECVKSMSKMYLGRILDSFTKDLGPQEEDEAREYIARNAEELADPDNVARRLDLFELDHSTRILVYYVLETLINAHECRMTERELDEGVRSRQKEVIDASEADDALRYADDRAVDIFRTVLETAFENDEISRDEYRLVERLRSKLGVTRRHQRLLEAQLGKFPKPDGEPHTPSEINDAHKHLQNQGIVFYCNRIDDGRNVVLPEEIQPGVKRVLGIELSDGARELLWKNLRNDDLKEVLRAQNLPIYGSKDELVDRVISSGIKPSEGLDALKSDDLYEICSDLPGVKVSGTKTERIDRVVEHFDHLVIRDLPEEAQQAELYYQYLGELAARDRENLLANDVVSKDRDIDGAFEEGTRYLFQHKLGVALREMEGSDHPDGSVEFPDGTVFMWDNKSKEGEYTFPNSHVDQFKRYIRDITGTRVNAFMIVVPEVGDGAEQNCIRLKHESNHDTDVAIVRAEDLKWVAEHWQDDTSADTFDLAVFNQTGILERDQLEQMMEVLL